MVSPRGFAICWYASDLSDPHTAQTDVKDTDNAASASNFLEREKAVLGDDAHQFATVEDAGFDEGDDNLLGGGEGVASPGNNDAFESQFPDITSPNEVSQ